jgi:hypothetical protein
VSNFAVETTVSGLNPNSGVDIRVAARNDAGVGFYSLYGSTTTLPEGPSLVYVGTITGLTVEVNWVEADGADGRYFYKIFPYARVGAEIVPQVRFDKTTRVGIAKVSKRLATRKHLFVGAAKYILPRPMRNMQSHLAWGARGGGQVHHCMFVAR